MKAINLGKTMSSIDITDKQPCWYATLESVSSRSKAKWVVGVKREDKNNQEYSFKISKLGDVYDEDFWTDKTSKDFAIKLIEKFKSGGKEALKEWLGVKK